jgi:hypothetical protein
LRAACLETFNEQSPPGETEPHHAVTPFCDPIH